MRTSKNRGLEILAILLILGLPICVVGAGVYAAHQPRLYSAAAIIQLKFPSLDGPQMESVFQKARQMYHTDLELHLASSTSLEPLAASGQFRITAIDADPLTTMNTANGLTIFVIDGLRKAISEEGRRVTVLQKAEMPRAPSFPNVLQIMTFGISLGFLCGAVGAALLLIAYARRASGESISR